MDEYIAKTALYGEVAKLEELARNRYLETPSNSPAYLRYTAQMQERTALKHLIADFPAANVEPVRHGRWIPAGVNYYTRISQCTNCCAKYDFRSKYCPNCGARMDEEGNT